jgi:hypothetical protein
MIDRIAMTLLRIELMDRDALESDTPGVLTERQSRDYLAWVNTAGRLLRSLGLEATEERTPSLHELINAPVSEAAPAPLGEMRSVPLVVLQPGQQDVSDLRVRSTQRKASVCATQTIHIIVLH